MPASWSWSGRVSVVRRVCASPSSSLGGRTAPFHNITQMVKSPPSEASRRPTLRPGRRERGGMGRSWLRLTMPPTKVTALSLFLHALPLAQGTGYGPGGGGTS